MRATDGHENQFLRLERCRPRALLETSDVESRFIHAFPRGPTQVLRQASPTHLVEARAVAPIPGGRGVKPQRPSLRNESVGTRPELQPRSVPDMHALEAPCPKM